MGDVYLLFGRNGWIGGKLIELLTAQGKTFYLSDTRTQMRETVIAEIEKYKPTHILNAAGVTGRPNVDWCEDHRQETIQSNVLGVMTIADLCEQHKIHHLLYATGCIFEYDAEHVIGGKGFTEEDKANFHASFYSHTKAMVEELLREYKYVCSTCHDFLHVLYTMHHILTLSHLFTHPLKVHVYVACAHAHLRRPVSTQLLDQNHQVREGGQRAQLHDHAHRSAASVAGHG